MTRFRFGNLQYFFRPCASSKPNGYTFPKVNEIIPYFCRRLHLHPIFLSRGKFYFPHPPPCGGKSKSRFRPVKSRVKRTSAPRANARICLFTKCPRPPPLRPPATAPEPLRGREVGFLPLFAARRSYAKSPPVPTSIRPSTPPTFLHIPAPLLSFRSSSTDEIRRSSPTHPLWGIHRRKRRRGSLLSWARSLRASMMAA